MASFRKASQQEFQHQIKEIRAQLFDQVKCLEQRTDVQVAILGEVNDFVKKKAELDLEYSKQLDKLVKSVMLKHKNEKLKRSNWALHSTCQLWQQLVDDAKEEARQRSITADVCANYVAPAVAQRSVALQKIAKKCREIGVLAQSEVVRVLHELHTAMKTYQHCFAQFNALSVQLQQAEVQRNKVGPNSSTRKQRSVQKSYDKKSEKYTSARLKCTRARNEYLLCIDAANASLHKFFADDISDLVDCSDLGMDWWLSLLLQNMITARKSACQMEMNALANLGSFKESLQLAADKQRFFESNHQTFMLPKRFDFRCEEAEHVGHISVAEGSLAEEFRQRHHQIRKRLDTLKAESEMGWQSMESAERQIRDLLSACTVVQVSEFGIATSADDDRRPSETVESELAKAYDAYMQTFSYYLYTANLVMRLEARADGIGNALSSAGPPADDRQQHSSPSRLTVGGSSLSSATGQIPESLKNGGGGGLTSVASSSITIQEQTELSERTDSLEWAQRYRKKRIGSQASTELTHPLPSAIGSGGVGGTNVTPLWRRPRLFGGSLEEYTELTGEPIPLVVVSCIRILSQHALHHQGIFRISGSQLEINHMREAFESGEDPLRDVRDGNDANSIAGVLKLYLRELREPLFPFYLFDLLTDCAKCSSTVDFVNKICPLLNKLPRATYLLLRYLFAFLNHLSELSDENMMDPYNLAICFGPTLLPIPEGKDQVCYQNSVNEVVKNLIVHSDAIFNARVPGPRYEKYALEATDGGGTPAGDISAELELFVDDEVPSADVAAAQPTPLDNWPPSTRQQQLHKRLSSVDLPFPPPSPQFHRFHPQLQSPASASPPQQQQHYQRLPFLANHHNQQKQQHQVITETSSGGVVGQQDNSSSGANATSSLIDWSLCNAAGSVGGLPLPPVLCPTAVATDVHYHQQQQQNHQRKFLTTTNNNNGSGGNINNYCYSSSESGIADSTNGTATSPRPAVQQQQLVRQRMCGGGSGPNALVDTPMDNVADLYTSIHKGDHHRFPRHAMPTTVSSVTTSTSSATTATQPSTVQCVRQQQLQPNVVGAVQQYQHKSPPVILRFGSGQTVPGEHRAHHHPPYPKQQQQQQQQSGVSPPPYTALYGTKMVAAAGRSPPITTAALHDVPSKSAAISPLTTAICGPSPTRRRNSFHDNMNSAAIAATSVSVVQSQHRAPFDKSSLNLTPTGQSAATDQLKKHRLEQVNAIDELLGKLSTATGGGGCGGGGDH